MKYRFVKADGRYKIRFSYYSANLQCKMWSVRSSRAWVGKLLTDTPLKLCADLYTGRLVME